MIKDFLKFLLFMVILTFIWYSVGKFLTGYAHKDLSDLVFFGVALILSLRAAEKMMDRL